MIRHIHRGVSHSRPGQALVEFAMVIPILLLLVFGIIEFARAWQTYQTLTDAAREGARMSVVSLSTVTPQQVEDAVKASLARSTLKPGNATVTASVPHPHVFPGDRGDPVTVKIDYDFQFIVIGRLVGWATGTDKDEIRLSTSFVMRKE